DRRCHYWRHARAGAWRLGPIAAAATIASATTGCTRPAAAPATSYADLVDREGTAAWICSGHGQGGNMDGELEVHGDGLANTYDAGGPPAGPGRTAPGGRRRTADDGDHPNGPGQRHGPYRHR